MVRWSRLYSGQIAGCWRDLFMLVVLCVDLVDNIQINSQVNVSLLSQECYDNDTFVKTTGRSSVSHSAQWYGIEVFSFIEYDSIIGRWY